MQTRRLDAEQTGVMIIDVQEKLFPAIDRSCDVLETMLKAVEGFKLFDLPIIVSEQYPQGLGRTLLPLRQQLPETQSYWSKTSFSCMQDTRLKAHLTQLPVKQWIVMGIEAHVCVLQTVFDLLAAGKSVMVLNDAISSRSVFDFSTAIAEMRDAGARIGSVEIALFELLGNSQAPQFKELNALIKRYAQHDSLQGIE